MTDIFFCSTCSRIRQKFLKEDCVLRLFTFQRQVLLRVVHIKRVQMYANEARLNISSAHNQPEPHIPTFSSRDVERQTYFRRSRCRQRIRCALFTSFHFVVFCRSWLRLFICRHRRSICVSANPGSSKRAALIFPSRSRAFAKAGYRVALIARSPEHLENTAKGILTEGGEVSILVHHYSFSETHLYTPLVPSHPRRPLRSL